MTFLFPSYVIECVLAFGACVLLSFLAYSPFDYWKKRGIPQVKVQYPFIGNSLDTLLKSTQQIVHTYYNEFPNEKYVGTYKVRTPTLLIRDPDVVESVMIKDFSHFQDRGNRDGESKNLLTKHLLNLEGDHWKSLRSKLTPTFSSGKLKGMHSQLLECASSLMKMMKNLDDGRPFEVRDVVSRFTMDVIASCAFGLNIDTINDSESKFRKIGIAMFAPSTKGKILLTFRSIIQPLLKILRVRLIPKKYADFFIKSVDETLEYREKNNVVRQDFLQLMNAIRTKELEMIKNKEMREDDPHIFDHNTLVSNALVFFLAGFETTATTVSYAMYELAVNPGVQSRLFEEVSSVLKKHDGQATFNAVQEMTYMDQVISETLRKYPPAVSVSRKVTKEYPLPGIDDVVLPEGMNVTVPIYGLHHDPQYFPEPETFRPERFDEEKDSVRKGTYLPFGAGPRICIGARFAKLEAKVCLATILAGYKIVQCSKTKVPLTFDRNTLLLVPEGGIWVSVVPRK